MSDLFDQTQERDAYGMLVEVHTDVRHILNRLDRLNGKVAEQERKIAELQVKTAELRSGWKAVAAVTSGISAFVYGVLYLSIHAFNAFAKR